MTWTDISLREYFYVAITLISLLGMALSWLVKLRWSDQKDKAKQAELAAKDAEIALQKRQIDFLNEFTPTAIREHAKQMKEGLEEVISDLNKSVANKDGELLKLKQASQQDKPLIEQLTKERDGLRVELSRAKKAEENIYIITKELMEGLDPNVVAHKVVVKSATGQTVIADKSDDAFSSVVTRILFAKALMGHVSNLSNKSKVDFVQYFGDKVRLAESKMQSAPNTSEPHPPQT